MSKLKELAEELYKSFYNYKRTQNFVTFKVLDDQAYLFKDRMEPLI